MPMDLAAINPLLKEDYEDYVSELVHTETTAIDLFTEGDTESADGRRVILPAHLRRDHAGVMFVGEGRQLPTPAQEQAEFFTIPFRKSAARFQITKEAVDQAQTSKGSFVRTLSYVMDHLVENVTDMRNKAICHYGSDILAVANATLSSVTAQTCKSPGGVALPTGVTNATRFLQVGQNIAAIRNGAILANTPVTVTAISGTTFANFTVSTNTASILSGDAWVRAGSSTVTDALDTGYLQAPMGFLGLIDDGTYISNYFNIARTTWDVAKSFVFTSVGALSSDILQQGVDVAYSRGRGKLEKFLCEQAVRRQLLALREGDVRFVGSGNVNPDAGSIMGHTGKTLTWSDIPILVDYNMPYGVLLGIDPSTLVRYVVVPGKFEDWGGSVLLPSTSAHQATGLFYIYDNFFCDAPNKNVRWDGIDVTVNNIHIE